MLQMFLCDEFSFFFLDDFFFTYKIIENKHIDVVLIKLNQRQILFQNGFVHFFSSFNLKLFKIKTFFYLSRCPYKYWKRINLRVKLKKQLTTNLIPFSSSFESTIALTLTIIGVNSVVCLNFKGFVCFLFFSILFCFINIYLNHHFLTLESLI